MKIVLFSWILSRALSSACFADKSDNKSKGNNGLNILLAKQFWSLISFVYFYRCWWGCHGSRFVWQQQWWSFEWFMLSWGGWYVHGWEILSQCTIRSKYRVGDYVYKVKVVYKVWAFRTPCCYRKCVLSWR